MLDVLKIVLVFTVILMLLHLKWNIGYVLVAVSAFLAVLYLMPPLAVAATIWTAVTAPITIKLFFALTLIRALEMILREQQVMAGMMETAKRYLKSRRAVVVSMPLLIGMLPSVGGAYFSAPMVDESTKTLRMPPEEKAFINYWYRHPWEYILPLYPGILLASALTGVELRSLISANMTYAVLMIVTGFMFSMRHLPARNGAVTAVSPSTSGAQRADGKLIGSSFWNLFPIAFILLLVIALDIELHYALGITLAGLFLFYRYALRDVVRTLRYGFAKEVIVLIFGVMVFKFTMDHSGAVVNLSRFFCETGLPLMPVLILLPFISGLLTGLSVGFVGSTFPLLMSFAGRGHLNEATLAFAAGTLGVMISPVHLCFILTREYFKADVAGLYSRIIPASLIIMASAVALYYTL